MSFDEFVTGVFITDGLGPEMIACQDTVQVSIPGDRGPETVNRLVWRFVTRDASGPGAGDQYRIEDLFLVVRWLTFGWGRNTTGEGLLQTEPEKDLIRPVSRVLDSACPRPTWAQAGQLFNALLSGSLSQRGKYDERIENGLSEYEYTYAYTAVKLRSLYSWLVDNGLLAAIVR